MCYLLCVFGVVRGAFATVGGAAGLRDLIDFFALCGLVCVFELVWLG